MNTGRDTFAQLFQVCVFEICFKGPVLPVPFKLATGYFAEMTEALTSTNPVIAIIHVRIVICQDFDTKNPPKRACV